MSENLEQIPPDLVEFRQEMRNWIKEELAKKERGEKYDPHAEDFNSDHLTEKELKIWQKIKDGTVTYREMRSYINELMSEKETSDKNIWNSRYRFQGLASNLANQIIGQRELAEYKNKKG